MPWCVIRLIFSIDVGILYVYSADDRLSPSWNDPAETSSTWRMTLWWQKRQSLVQQEQIRMGIGIRRLRRAGILILRAAA